MKRRLFFASYILFSLCLNAQDGAIKQCSEINFLRMDSVLAAGKDPFTEWSICLAGKRSPSYKATAMTGGGISSDMFKDKIVVITVFSVDCVPCIAEVPALNRLVDTYATAGVSVLGITADKAERVKESILSRYAVNYPVSTDNQPLVDLFGGPGYPKFFIINKGVIVDAWIGGDITAGENNPVYGRVKTILDRLIK